MDLENSNTISSDLIRGHINTIILNILYENDRYGYEIIQQIELKSNGQYSLKQPTLYSALKRLEQLNFVTSYWGTGMSNGGRRKYFQITDKGRDFVQQNRAEWEYSRTIIDNLVSDKIFDFDKNTPPSNIDFSALKKRIPKQAKIEDDSKLSTSIHTNQIENSTAVEHSFTSDNQLVNNTVETKIDNNHLATATFACTTIENNTNTVPLKTNLNTIQEVVEQTQNENIQHAIEEVEQQNLEEQAIYSILENIATTTSSSSAQQHDTLEKIENVIDDEAENLVNVIKNVTNPSEIQFEEIEEMDKERTKKMHENYLKLIGDYDALQTHYIYTLLKNENPAFAAIQTKSFYTNKGIELDYYSTSNFDEIPYTSDTIWASSLTDDNTYAQESPNLEQIQENVLQQLPIDILQQNTTMNKDEVFIEVQDKYSDVATANLLYTNLQDKINPNDTNNIQDTDLIYNLLEENSSNKNKKSSSNRKKIIKNWFVNTSYCKLFIILSNIIFVIALIEALTIFFIGRKYNISYQFALSVAILYTIAYILSTIFATRKNSYDALVSIGQKKYMWYFLLFYFIALVISIISLYLLTKTFQNTVEIDFWFYSISFNLLTFNLPLFSILYCCIVSFKQNNKKDTP